jgi:hypothetical protein
MEGEVESVSINVSLLQSSTQLSVGSRLSVAGSVAGSVAERRQHHYKAWGAAAHQLC